MQLFIIVLFIVFGGLFYASDQEDKKDFKTGKQKRVKGSSGPYQWTENGKYTKGTVILYVIVIIFIFIVAALFFN
jgi:hypothetical protein